MLLYTSIKVIIIVKTDTANKLRIIFVLINIYPEPNDQNPVLSTANRLEATPSLWPDSRGGCAV